MTYTLTGRYPLGDLTGRDGERLRFVPSTTIVGADNIILPAPVEVTLDSDGSFSTPLVGTDDADYQPAGLWVWTCYELMTGGRAPWSFELTADSDLSDLATVATPDEPSLYVPITRTLTAGAGLTGGGSLAANRTFNVGAGTGITVNADDVAVDTSVIATRTYADGIGLASDATAAGALDAHAGDSTAVHGIADTAALVLTNDARLSDDRDPTAHASSHQAAGDDPLSGISASQVSGTAVIESRTLTAGAGLTGGGDLSANRTVAVGAGTGITVNADDVEVKYGTTAGTAAQGNDSRITGAIQSTVADANSVLYAVTDNTPAALAVPASSLVGRGLTGNIDALSPATVRSDFDLARLSTVGNLLTANQSTGGDTLGTAVGFVGTAGTCTIESGITAYTGTYCIKVTASGGSSGAIVAAATSAANYVPVVAGRRYSAVIAMKSDTITKNAQASIGWRDAAGAGVSLIYGDVIALSATWTLFYVSGVCPAGASLAFVKSFVSTSASGDVHYVDQCAFWEGAGGTWHPPGIPVVDSGEVWHIAAALVNAGASTYYAPLDDASHTPINVVRCETDANKIRVYWSRRASDIGAVVVTGDESTSSGYLFGASAGVDYADVYIYARATGAAVDPRAMPTGSQNLWIHGVMR